jgi:hypothetical protein
MRIKPLIGAVLLSLVSVLAAGCDDAEQEVRDTFHQYMAAQSDKDVDTVLALTDPRYIEHLDFVVKMARTGARDRVLQLTPAERVQVVRMRNRLTKPELAALDGKGWLTRTVKEEWRIDEVLDGFELGNVTIKKPRAFAKMDMGGFPTELKMEFVKTGDRWVLDPTAIEDLINEFLRKQTSSPEAENHFILERERWRTGNRVPATIWGTPK